MRHVAAVTAPVLLFLAGCLSAPIPQELVDVKRVPAQEPVHASEVVRLSRAGVSDEVLVGLIRSRGLAERPGLERIAMLRHHGVSSPVLRAMITAEPRVRMAEPRIVYRELFIPLWPSFARGRWHVGLRIGCSYGTDEAEVPEIVPPEPDPSGYLPRFIEP